MRIHKQGLQYYSLYVSYNVNFHILYLHKLKYCIGFMFLTYM